jgi:apolipoprotein N-acyltransferase
VQFNRGLRILGSRYAVAVCGGLMLTAAFPKLELASLAWVAPGVVLMSAAGQSGRSSFWLGYMAGLAHFLSSLYWLLLIPCPWAPILGWLALGAYNALYFAVWVRLCWRLLPPSKEPVEATPVGPSWLRPFQGTTWMQRLFWMSACAALWVALEMIRARLFSGFPWNLLGASQFRMLLVVQIASLTGVYGISFLAVWFSAALACAVVVLARNPANRWAWLGEVIFPLLVLYAVLMFGVHKLSVPPNEGRTLKMALIQPSIPQTLIWDRNENTNRFRELIKLSELALATKPDLLVWPEAATPNYLRFDPDLTYPAVTNLVLKHHVWLILGADDAAPHEPPRHTNDYDVFNSSFLVGPDGELHAIYRKQQLVVFGEYIPLVKWLPFLRWLTPIEDGFTEGTHPVPFVMPSLGAETSVLICFEDAFPHLVRHSVTENTDFLLNLTNDGWFGKSAQQWQQAAMSVFRAVENGLPLVRCTNNGLTCWVDALGRLFPAYFGAAQDIYGTGFKIFEVPLRRRGAPATFYNRHGDLFGWACVGIAGMLAMYIWFRDRRTGRASHSADFGIA